LCFRKNPENPPGRLGNPGNSGAVFSGFSDDAKIQPISGKSAGKNFGSVFRRKISENHRKRKIPEIRKISSAKTSILENSTPFAERFKTHILRAKIDKKKVKI
jgi:hypothetical protein